MLLFIDFHFVVSSNEEEEENNDDVSVENSFRIKCATRAEMKEKNSEMKEKASSFKCQICGKTFHSLSMLSLHYKSKHHSLHMCNVCGKYLSLDALQAHMNKHAEIYRLSCSVCPQRFRYQINLRSHIRSVHPGLGVNGKNGTEEQRNSGDRDNSESSIFRLPYECNFCFNAFSQPNELSSHIERIHSDRNPFKCKVCSKTFLEISELNKHMQGHSTGLPFECKICTARFADKTDNETHQKTHIANEYHQEMRSKEKKCKDCGMIFTDMSEYLAHTHSGGPPFKCYVCSKEFVQRRFLHRHIKFHTGNHCTKNSFNTKVKCDWYF